MATEIYLGYPPENIKKWIEKNYKPAFKLTDPLCFTAEEAGSTIKMSKHRSPPTVYLETSPTGEEGSWSDFIVCTEDENGNNQRETRKRKNKSLGEENSRRDRRTQEENRRD